MVKENGERPIIKALLEAKKKFGPLVKDKTNPFYKSKYADLAALMDVVEDPLLEQGVVISQPTRRWPDGVQYINTELKHVSGDQLDSTLDLPAGLDAQKMSAAITYLKRAALQAILGIPARDDDGESVMGRGGEQEGHQKPPSKPATPAAGPGGSFTTDPRQAAKDAKKATAKDVPKVEPASKDGGLANVTIQSIAAGDHPTVKFSKLITSGGLFIVMGDSPKFTDAMKAAQLASLNKTNVVIEYHVNAKGSNIVDILRVEE